MTAEVRRYRLSVPLTDEVVLAWMNNQDNMSASMRAVIKEAVRKHGLGDVFSSKLPDELKNAQPTRRPRGRPCKKQAAMAGTSTLESVASEETVDDVVVPSKEAPRVFIGETSGARARSSSTSRSASTAFASDMGGGIQLGADAMSDFGVTLDFDDGSDIVDGGMGIDADIADLMGKE